MKHFYYFFTTVLLLSISHAMDQDSPEQSLEEWEVLNEVAQQDFVRRRSQTRSMPASPKQEPRASKMPLAEYVQRRRRERRREEFKTSVRQRIRRAQLQRARSEMRSPYPKGPRYTESLQQFRREHLHRGSRIYIQPKAAITIASLMFLLKKQIKRMNNWQFTLCVTTLYEILRGQNLILKLPLLSEKFKMRLASAWRGGLYASITNAVVAEKIPPYLPHVRIRQLNGWKVIGNYILIDLVSSYGWDAIKKFREKQKTDSKISDEKPNDSNQSSKLMTLIGWGIKTLLATAIPDLIS
jgi:hypothetical protein